MPSENLKEEFSAKVEPKRNTVVVGERMGYLLSRLRGANADARCALHTLAGYSSDNCRPSSEESTVIEGFFDELLDAISQIESEVDELQHTIDRLGNL